METETKQNVECELKSLQEAHLRLRVAALSYLSAQAWKPEDAAAARKDLLRLLGVNDGSS